jgi:hypothetical protein
VHNFWLYFQRKSERDFKVAISSLGNISPAQSCLIVLSFSVVRFFAFLQSVTVFPNASADREIAVEIGRKSSL